MYKIQNPNWNLAQKFLFLSLFIYAILYIFPFPFSFTGLLAGVGETFNEYTWHKFLPWVGHEIFGIEGPIDTGLSGSGDRTVNWIQLPVQLFLALIASGLWLLISRRKIDFERLRRWLTTYILAFLICTMILYGMAKVIKLQFPDTGLTRLTTEFGQLTPFRLAWSFMGYSTLYTFIAGFSEVIGALLLVFRKTRNLGAMLILFVMLNVFMMNMSYDIPVKLFSFHLVIFSFYILCLDYKRLVAFFFTNNATEKAIFLDHFANPTWNKVMTIGKYLLVSLFLIMQIVQAVKNSKIYGKHVEIPPLYGIYDVQTFVKNQDTLPPLITDDERWRRLIIEKNDLALIYKMDQQATPIYHKVEMDTTNNMINFINYGDSSIVFPFSYNIQDDSLFLMGRYYNDSIEIKSIKYNLERFKLINTGFNWVNEYPN